MEPSSIRRILNKKVKNRDDEDVENILEYIKVSTFLIYRILNLLEDIT
jgi:hypothetical protein